MGVLHTIGIQKRETFKSIYLFMYSKYRYVFLLKIYFLVSVVKIFNNV